MIMILGDSIPATEMEMEMEMETEMKTEIVVTVI